MMFSLRPNHAPRRNLSNYVPCSVNENQNKIQQLDDVYLQNSLVRVGIVTRVKNRSHLTVR